MGGYILISKSVRKPVFMKMWEEHPKVWKLLIDVGIFIKYKTLNSQKTSKYCGFTFFSGHLCKCY